MSTVSTFQDLVQRLEQRVRLAVYGGELARHGAILLAGSAVVFLVLRFWGGCTRTQAAWSFLAVLPALVTAWWLGARRFVSRDFAVAWIDLQLGGTGEWLTRYQLRHPSDGEPAVPPVALPRIRSRALWGPPLPSLLFAGLALWVEPSAPWTELPLPLHESLVEQLQEKLATLVETVDQRDELAQEAERRLDQIEREAEAGRFDSAFEAIDRLESTLEQEALSLQQSMEDSLEALARPGLEAALQDQDSPAGQELAQSLEQLAREGLARGLPEELARMLPDAVRLPALEALAAGLTQGMEGLSAEALAELLSQLTAEELAALQQALAGLLEGKLGKLVAARLIDPSKLRSLKEIRAHECDEDCEKPGGA